MAEMAESLEQNQGAFDGGEGPDAPDWASSVHDGFPPQMR